ncbi:unnamed protein product [Thlaspi arvense]|uniref:KIB1-4 beta-propeller domain-containing protein n=1 Tax=Thlaspi arvense TaxID=13288 RepID=A0AAU9SNJ8_THLAR|nr:unnamed protein product [Thlaspi arvense]
MGMIGTSNGWLATLKKDEVCLREYPAPRLQGRDPKSISLPPLESLSLCQTQMVTNIAMSSPFPEEEDCVVAVNFLGPQLSFCRSAAGSNSEWINIRIENPCFFSSRVMFSEKDELFRIPGSGGHLVGSWDLSCKHKHPEWYKKTVSKTIIIDYRRMETEALMVLKLEEEEGNAVYTRDIGDLVISLTRSESFCVPANPRSDMRPNRVKIIAVDETDLAAQNWNC